MHLFLFSKLLSLIQSRHFSALFHFITQYKKSSLRRQTFLKAIERVKGSRLSLIAILFYLILCNTAAFAQQNIFSNILEYTSSNGKLYFTASDETNGVSAATCKGQELWQSDGTAAGTKLVKDIMPGCIGSNPRYLTDVNGTLFFIANENYAEGFELWKTNGTEAGTVRVVHIKFKTNYEDIRVPIQVTKAGNLLYFTGGNDVTGYELW